MRNDSSITMLGELEAVNEILSTIGEAPVDTLINNTNIDAINALTVLRNVSRKEQARGWSFNTLYKKLVPDIKGKIHWNNRYLYIKPFGCHKLVKDGAFIKDLYGNIDIFNKEIDVEIIYWQDFEEMPEQMKNYIIAKASYEFQMKFFGDRDLMQTTQMYITECWQQLQEFELDNNDYNALNLWDTMRLRRR